MRLRKSHELADRRILLHLANQVAFALHPTIVCDMQLPVLLFWKVQREATTGLVLMLLIETQRTMRFNDNLFLTDDGGDDDPTLDKNHREGFNMPEYLPSDVMVNILTYMGIASRLELAGCNMNLRKCVFEECKQAWVEILFVQSKLGPIQAQKTASASCTGREKDDGGNSTSEWKCHNKNLTNCSSRAVLA